MKDLTLEDALVEADAHAARLNAPEVAFDDPDEDEEDEDEN